MSFQMTRGHLVAVEFDDLAFDLDFGHAFPPSVIGVCAPVLAHRCYRALSAARYSPQCETAGDARVRPRPVSQPGISLETMSQEIEIGLGKKARMAYALDDVSIVPSRRTRDSQDVSTSWQVDAYEFDVPVIGARWIRSPAPPRR